MLDHRVVSRAAWLEARVALLEEEKALTRASDALAKKRRALPWVELQTAYAFNGPDGPETLAGLFGTHSQLVVYHFMLGDGWEAGCPSCSFWADGYDGLTPHLAARDTAFVTVANAPFDQIEAYRNRMGWSFKWVSSHGSDFNTDFHVTIPDTARTTGTYNFQNRGFPVSEAPGISVFARDRKEGPVYHTYSAYARGLDRLNAGYQVIDLTPKGRDEDGLGHSMSWLRRHDEY
ncbi:MAG: DUF899 domain-containing protein [Pseudomonadota bacterium]